MIDPKAIMTAFDLLEAIRKAAQERGYPSYEPEHVLNALMVVDCYRNRELIDQAVAQVEQHRRIYNGRPLDG